MIRHILKGWLFWQRTRIKYKINYSKVVIVLSGQNNELDRQVLLHLRDFIRRKHADTAIVLCGEGCENKWIKFMEDYSDISVHSLADGDMTLLYSYYNYMKFFDNIVFTYTDEPENNLLGKYIRNTEVNEEDAACLALYHLRHVPDIRS